MSTKVTFVLQGSQKGLETLQAHLFGILAAKRWRLERLISPTEGRHGRYNMHITAERISIGRFLGTKHPPDSVAIKELKDIFLQFPGVVRVVQVHSPKS